jgi:ABC-type molybdate transport system substrate-binding protein
MRRTLSAALFCGLGLLTALPVSSAGEPIQLYAAGSLRAALTDVAAAFTERYQIKVAATFAPSGLLRERIEAEATRLGLFILSPAGQEILHGYGFDAGGRIH